MFPQSVEYSDKTIQTAIQQLSRMSADMDGTNIFDPLASIFDKIDIERSKFPISIFFLTDGGVGNAN